MKDKNSSMKSAPVKLNSQIKPSNAEKDIK